MATAAKYRPNVEIAADSESLARQAVELFCTYARKAIDSKGVFRVAVSGGNTPRHFFELLGEEPAAVSLDWSRIHLFWVDERYVSQQSLRSNYKLAADTFLTKVGIAPDNIHRVRTEYADFSEAARQYEHEIRDVFGVEPGQIPTFDLIVLGMGADGHTGSLFPNSYATFDTNDLACVVYVLDEKLNRITLTHPVLCAADEIVVLVSGAEKAAILNEVLSSEPDEVKYPIHVLWHALDRVIWLVDREAAEQLPKQT